MIRLDPIPGSRSATVPQILLFGAGLIGDSIARSIANRRQHLLTRTKSHWGEPGNLAEHELQMEAAVKKYPSERPLEIVWSAGSSGFNCDRESADREFKEFAAHVGAIGTRAAQGNRRVNFTLISSAGGLFEGQRLVNTESKPEPKRPYGHLKLSMERHLKNSDFPTLRIFRPTTVFGFIHDRQRKGLISTLIENGIKGRGSEIFGSVSTLRDYIFVEDIGEYACSRILEHGQEAGLEIKLLSSGKPSTIGEIIYNVESALRTKIYMHYSLSPSNLANITYQQSLWAGGRSPTDLSTAIRMVCRDYQSRF